MHALPLLALAILTTAGGSTAPETTAPKESATGFWTGAAVFRGDAWPLELEVEPGPDGPSALLGLPELGMIREPIPTRRDGETLRVALPFGLGEVPLEGSGSLLSGSLRLGSDTLLVHLERVSSDGSGVPPLRREPIRFRNGPATLVGELVLPPGDGPHPAVVLLHGSAPQGLDTWAYRSWAELFARRGIAALRYDKRGVGGSTGPWMDVSFPDLEDLAADAVAAIDLLAARPEIDPERIGLSGGSQAAWVAFLAVGRSPAISFLILRSAPAGTPGEQELLSVRERVGRAFGREAAERAVAHTRLLLAVAGSDPTGSPGAETAGWKALLDSTAASAAEPWAELVQRPEDPDDLFWWRRNQAVDPLGSLSPARDLRLPVLLLYGEDDPVVPPGRHAPVLAERLPDATVRIFPRADHRLETPGGTGPDGRWHFPRLAPGVLGTIDAWLVERGIVSGRVDGSA
ncbi:MAG: alpha/beta fold hydrolase [Acidobacteriota bacterium]|jgi:hypothetical protein